MKAFCSSVLSILDPYTSTSIQAESSVLLSCLLAGVLLSCTSHVLLSRLHRWSVAHESFGEESSFGYFAYRMVAGARTVGDAPVPFHGERQGLRPPMGKQDTEHTHMDREDCLLGMEL